MSPTPPTGDNRDRCAQAKNDNKLKNLHSRYPFIYKVIFAPLFTLSLIYFLKITLWFYPLIFSATLIITNHENLKFQFIYGFLLSTLGSYLAFFTGIFGVGFFGKIFNYLNIITNIEIDDGFYTDLAFRVSVFTIAPLLTIIFNKLIFSRICNYADRITFILISVLFIFSYLYNDINSNSYFNILNLWYIFFLATLQISINNFSINKIAFIKSSTKFDN